MSAPDFPDRKEFDLKLVRSQDDCDGLENTDLLHTRPVDGGSPGILTIRGGAANNGRFYPWYPTKIGRFEIHAVLGQGGFAIVYRGWDPALKRWLAIKVPRLHCLPEPAARNHFLLEAEAAARLEHPGIVAIYEAGTDGETPYIAMAQCRGPTLAKWLAERSNPVGPRLAAQILLQLAEAVQYSHEHGILHRDIKPANVLLFPDESSSCAEFPYIPRLGDFGLAKVLEQDQSASGTTDVVGTPRYMAPEAINGTKSGAATSDVYSLGAILYTLLTGQPPFAAASVAETLRQISEEDPVAPHIISSSAGLELSNVCQKCLEKSVERRYATAQELADDLRNYLEGRPVKARPLSVTGRLEKWVRRRPLVAGLTLTTSLLLGSLLFLGIQYVWLWQKALEMKGLHSDQLERSLQDLRASREMDALKTEEIRNSRKENEQLAIAGDIHLSADARRNGDPLSALRILMDHEIGRQSSLKGINLFAWRYLYSRVQRKAEVLPSAEQAIWDVERSADNTRLITCGSEGFVTVYQLVPGFERKQHRRIASTELNCVAISPDRRMIATGGDSGKVWLLDAETLEIIQEFTAVKDNHVYSVQFLPDGRLLAAGRSPKITLYDPALKQITRQPAIEGFSIIESLRVSRDGQWLVAGSGHGVLCRLRISSEGTLAEDWRTNVVAPDSGNDIVNLCFSPDESSVFVSAGIGTILEYDLKTSQQLSGWQGLSRTHGLDVTDEYVFLGNNDGTCTVLRRSNDNGGLERFCQWAGHENRVTCVAAAAHKAPHIMTFDRHGECRLWPLPVEPILRFEPAPAAGVFNARDCAGWTRMGELVRTAGRRIEVLSLESGIWKTLIERPGSGPLFTCVRQIEETGEWLTGDADGGMAIFSPDGRTIRESIAATPGKAIISIACDMDGRTLVGYADRYCVSLWHRGAEKPGRILSDYSSVLVAPDGKWIACGNERTKQIELLDPNTFAVVRTLEAHTEVIRGLCCSATQDILVSVSHDRTLATWNTDSWKMRHRCSGLPVRLDAVAMHPDGLTVATYDYAGRISLWDARVGRTLMAIDETAPATIGLAFSPNGRYLAAWDCMGRITLIDSNGTPGNQRPDPVVTESMPR
ncbi:MAG: serine/threonine-protein kinase [Planctomycetaceae bacterium]